MVIEQGTILDSVEWNIERTADAMEGAVKELKIAQGYVPARRLVSFRSGFSSS
jgi:hypothetical protein